MSIERLAGCVITDEENRVLLLHRIDHNQWQLPGGRLKTDSDGRQIESPQQAAAREAHEELGLDFEPDHLRKIGGTVFRQGLVDYSCEWFRGKDDMQKPYLQQPDIYDDWQYYNLHRYGISRINLSPNVEHLKKRLQDGVILL